MNKFDIHCTKVPINVVSDFLKTPRENTAIKYESQVKIDETDLRSRKRVARVNRLLYLTCVP